MRQMFEPNSARVFAHRSTLRGRVEAAPPVLAKSAPDCAPGWCPLFRLCCVFRRRMANHMGLLIRLSLVRVQPRELASKSELWRPKDLTPGVERSTAGRFSFPPSLSRVFYAFRGSPAQSTAISVCREIPVSRTQPSRLRPLVRKNGPELSDSLFSGASRVNTEFSFAKLAQPLRTVTPQSHVAYKRAFPIHALRFAATIATVRQTFF